MAPTETTPSESEWRELFEQAPDGIFIANLEGRYIDVNPAGCRMLGRSREELLGRRITDLIPPEQASRLDDSKAHLLRGNIETSEWVLQHSDGHWVPVEISAKILPDGRWQAFVRDATERTRASEALIASETRFRQIVSIAADAIVSADEDENIVLFNEGAERIFGYHADEVLGKPLSHLLPERFRESHQAALREFVGSGVAARSMASRRPVLARRKNGEEFSAQISISQGLVRGRRLFTAVARDVSSDVRALEDERFLGEVSTVLASSLDVEVTLGQLSRLAVKYLGDVCVVDFADASGTRTVRVAVRDSDRPELAAAAVRYAPDRNGPYLGDTVFDTGVLELVEEVGPEYEARYARAPRCLELLQAAKPRAILAVPMRARGELRGVLTLFASSRTFDRRDVQMAGDVASRAATALDNASLHAALTRAHADLGERLRELQEAQERIRTLTGLLPVCAWCGLIRDDQQDGTWKRFEQYVSEHSSAEVTHGICPTCIEKHGLRPR